jgi:hypothetical protein
MFSVDNFYEYLMHQYSWPRKNNFLHVFETHGSRDLYSIILRHYNTNDFYNQVRKAELENYYGGLFMFDQEPMEFDQYYFDYSKKPSTGHEFHANFSTQEIMYFHLSKVHTPIICHSELNSDEIGYFTNRGFLDVHHWYHGLISRDWFRHWKHYTPHSNAQNRLGCYIRDTSGTREYRNNLIEFIKDQQNIYCPLLENQVFPSNESARLTWDDTANFDIHIVPETLFHTQKTHLTEKVLKPVAMEQPFILFAGPNSLEYMRQYGFQTFSSCWDESYDIIQDSNERYDAIVSLIKHLNALPPKEYKRIVARAKLIAKNNREHFYSQAFEDNLLTELHNNFNVALSQQQEDYFLKPGGAFFSTVNTLKDFKDNRYPNKILKQAPIVLKHIESIYPDVAKQILKQYPDLF